jgi:hypothetical protein
MVLDSRIKCGKLIWDIDVNSEHPTLPMLAEECKSLISFQI